MGRGRSSRGVTVYDVNRFRNTCENILWVKQSEDLLHPSKESFLVGVYNIPINSSYKKKNEQHAGKKIKSGLIMSAKKLSES